MELENKNTNHLNEFKTPKGYFNSVEDAVFEKLSQKNLLNNKGFKIPDNYFDTVEDAVFKKLDLNPKKEVKVVSFQKYILKYAAIVVILLMVGYFFSNKTTDFNELAISDIESYLNENIENIDVNVLTENLDDDDFNLFQDYNTNEIFNQLEDRNIEAILDEIENEL